MSQSEKIYGVSSTVTTRLQVALNKRFDAYIKPGEKIRVKFEHEEDFFMVHVNLADAPQKFSLELEAVLVYPEQPAAALKTTDLTTQMELLVGFLSEQFRAYFSSRRRERFHIDWRAYPVSGLSIRFRATLRNPDLEAQADALLGVDENSDEF